MNDAPIGIFDSGVGGLTVARAVSAQLPQESILYIGDTARVPYGGKSAATIERYSLEISTKATRALSVRTHWARFQVAATL